MKLQKKFKFLFGIFLFILTVFTIVQAPFLGLPLLAGVITQGILGGFSGKVGPVVGGKWKDIDYMRGYVIPANPNTTGQQEVRAKFAALVASAKQLLPSLLQVYWDPFYSNMSGFNAWLSANYAETNTAGKIDASCKMALGTLEPAHGISSAVISGTTLTVTFDGTIQGNGLTTDLIKAVVYNALTGNLNFVNSSETRNGSPAVLTVPSGLTDDDIVWIFFHRGTGSEFIVSDSISALITT